MHCPGRYENGSVAQFVKKCSFVRLYTIQFPDVTCVQYSLKMYFYLFLFFFNFFSPGQNTPGIVVVCVFKSIFYTNQPGDSVYIKH